jgi:hypothetical protein
LFSVKLRVWKNLLLEIIWFSGLFSFSSLSNINYLFIFLSHLFPTLIIYLLLLFDFITCHVNGRGIRSSDKRKRGRSDGCHLHHSIWNFVDIAWLTEFLIKLSNPFRFKPPILHLKRSVYSIELEVERWRWQSLIYSISHFGFARVPSIMRFQSKV